MLSYSQDGLEVDSCPECFGIWFDREELKQFVSRPDFADKLAERSEQISRAPRLQARRCPRCEVDLMESSLGEVWIDTCPRCRGIWLDQGELQRAVEQYQAGGRGNLVVLNQIAEGLRMARRQA
jgi:Zn-finger nucleic acid-binding protein